MPKFTFPVWTSPLDSRPYISNYLLDKSTGMVWQTNSKVAPMVPTFWCSCLCVILSP